MKTSMPVSAYILVFDLGGGTLDVTITHMGYDRNLWLSEVWKRVQRRMNVLESNDERNRLMACFSALQQGNQTEQYRARRELEEATDVPTQPSFVNVMACDGDANLGGQDFDKALANLVRDRLLLRVQKRYKGISKRVVEDLVFDVFFEFRLLRNCEEQKQIFSNRKVVQMGVKFNKLEKKERTIESPSLRELAVLKKKVNMLKLCRNSNPHDALVSLERDDESGDWFILWGRPRRTFKTSLFLRSINHTLPTQQKQLHRHDSKLFKKNKTTCTFKNCTCRCRIEISRCEKKFKSKTHTYRSNEKSHFVICTYEWRKKINRFYCDCERI